MWHPGLNFRFKGRPSNKRVQSGPRSPFAGKRVKTVDWNFSLMRFNGSRMSIKISAEVSLRWSFARSGPNSFPSPLSL